MAFTKVIQDEVTPLFMRLALKFGPVGQRRWLLQWGAATRREAQANALAKGGRRFWRAIARSVNVVSVANGNVQVQATHVAAAQKEFGGKISAPGKGEGSKNAGALSVPIKGSRAEGRYPSEFSDLQMIKRKGKPPLLVRHLGRAENGDKKSGGWRMEILFVLLKSVTTKKSPWWPKDERVHDLGLRLAQNMMARV